ncbi:MAG: hypothetical protein Q7J54_02995 [Candidatus Woesearchaeota archaeon]|nr:hypothetical protein [Candidatus Woesearchaeota archaeon]
MKCSKCNANLTKEDAFCPECGAKQNQKPQKEEWLKGKGKFLVGIGILIVIVLSFVLIYNKSNNQTVCNKPYILVGTFCCLDQNNNKICDDDEKPEVKECVFKVKEMDNFLMSYDYECKDVRDCNEFLNMVFKESGTDVSMNDMISYIDCIPSSYVPLSDIPDLPSDVIDKIKCKTKNDCIQNLASLIWTPPNWAYKQSYRCNDEGICEVLKNYVEVIKEVMFLSSKCVMPSGVACLDHRVTTSQIQLILKNDIGYGMSSINVNVVGCGSSSIPTRLANGARALYNITCSSALTLGAKFSGDITFTYTNDETELTRVLKGNLVSKVVE